MKNSKLDYQKIRGLWALTNLIKIGEGLKFESVIAKVIELTS